MAESKDDQKYTKAVDKPKAEVLSTVLMEHDVITAQREKRVELLKKLEKHSGITGKVGYLAFLCSEGISASIDSSDIPAIGDALLSLGEVDQLNLLINGPGGEGTVAEKIVELCRAHCKKFRVVIPNRAKSAATLIALGSDEIVMGYCSEIGPIDAQVLVVVGGVPRYVSAQSFIDSKASLEEEFKRAVKAKEDPRAILQQIASLDVTFIDHCGKLMDFGKEVARKYLTTYMFGKITPPSRRNAMVEKVLKGLSSVGEFKVHGRMINANAAKNDLHLNVKLLGKADDLWRDLWQYYIRADVFMSRTAGLAKLIETKDEMLIMSRASTK